MTDKLTKVCTKCKIEKSFSEFSKNKHSKDSFDFRCRLCNKEIHRYKVDSGYVPKKRKVAKVYLDKRMKECSSCGEVKDFSG